ncbi:hypothetical protein AA0311_2436 [Asaia bogorensis NBRC 16594]|nr:hypothetical protein AA0311_2436 [Asaia bogorensis NBRC 16594]
MRVGYALQRAKKQVGAQIRARKQNTALLPLRLLSHRPVKARRNTTASKTNKENERVDQGKGRRWQGKARDPKHKREKGGASDRGSRYTAQIRYA